MHDFAIETDADHHEKYLALHEPRTDEFRRTTEKHGRYFIRIRRKPYLDGKNIGRTERHDAERHTLPQKPARNLVDRTVTAGSDNHIRTTRPRSSARKIRRMTRGLRQLDGNIRASCAKTSDDIVEKAAITPAGSRIENDVNEAAEGQSGDIQRLLSHECHRNVTCEEMARCSISLKN